MTSLRLPVSGSRSQQRAAILRWSLAFILSLGMFVGGSAASVPGNRCKDRCNEAYRLRKDLCKSIPFKHERKRCENSAKHAKDDCKHRCR
jgi:hypothetical protein